MKDQLISFETAKLLTHTDFNAKDCDEGYVISSGELSTDYSIDWLNRKAIAAPTQSLLQKWLREIHNIFIKIEVNENRKYDYHGWDMVHMTSNTREEEVREFGCFPYRFDTYEEALEIGLREALELI